MSHGLRRPMHSISGLLSMLQDDKLTNEQQLLVDMMVKTSKVVTTIMNEVMDTSEKDHNGRFPLEMRHFQLHSMVREAACLAKYLCTFMGCNIGIEVDRSLPNHVMGDERRVFQVILHMVGNDLKCISGGYLTFRVLLENDISWKKRRSNSSSNDIYIIFEICMSIKRPQPEGITSSLPHCTQRYCSNEVEESLNFTVCRKLDQLMQGDIWRFPNPEGSDKSIAVVLGFQILPSSAIGKPEYRESTEQSHLQSILHGVRVLLADSDDFQIVLLDLHLPDLDGIEVTMRIQNFQSRNWPLIIGLAATADEEDVRGRCMPIGMNGIICRPVLLPGIAHELQKVLLQASRIMS
ncbi:Enoyl-[Datura stramonium]|uniref:Enoyl-[acyl-carrier-protein] reductase [NADPH, B-specific] 2, mitochondrial n=1 Tax=Datura stramonium TaxID=4076 RepID=A0ABS8UKH3_DATST|nr:Enoyl-[acyl-carrier-protein] reductase [NADPH, B-specific] 2, mitochondrial [Datura stramonium]